MPDLSATHDLHGAIWHPKRPQQETPDAVPDRSLDDLDITRYKALVEHDYAVACRDCDRLDITADQRQLAAGIKAGLAKALKHLDVARKAPQAVAANEHVEEPRVP